MAVARVHRTEIEYRGRLHRLGLEYEVFERVALEGVHAARETTAHDALIAAGIRRWLEMVRVLRDEMCPKGWHADRIDGHELLVDPTREFAINVLAGDAATGDPDAAPLTKSAKGKATRAAAHNNMRQANLFPLSAYTARTPTRLGNLKVWTLLHYHDHDESVIRMELSMPIGLDAQNRVADWLERIILPPVEVDADDARVGVVRRQYDDQAEINVEVTRRES